MSLDPRQLSHLLAIATHGSFNRAAAALNMSQPALSKNIALLEHRLGTTVIARTPRGSSLTRAGEILVRRARALETLIGDTVAEIRFDADGIEGPLKIGAAPSVMLDLVPGIIGDLVRERGPCAISVIEGLDDVLLPGLANGQLDILVGPVAGLHPAPASIVEEKLMEDPFSVGVAPDHRLAGRQRVTLKELLGEAWVLPLPGSVYFRHVEALFTGAGTPWPGNAVNTNSLALSERLVLTAGRIMTMTALQSMTEGARRLRRIALEQAGTRWIGLRYRRESRFSPIGLAALDLLRQKLGEGAIHQS
jgi:DNA-binding transcriptional LysR family regulator